MVINEPYYLVNIYQQISYRSSVLPIQIFEDKDYNR